MKLREFAGGVALGIVLAAHPAAASADAIGSVTYIKNLARGTAPGGETVRKLRGDAVVEDEVLQTFYKGALILTFADLTEVTLGGNATLVVDKFVYNPDRDTGTEVLRLVKGALFFATGKLRASDVTIETPVASIGVRGTEFSVELTEGGDLYVGVVSGEVSVNSNAGRSEKIGAGNTMMLGHRGGFSRSRGLRSTGSTAVNRRAAVGMAGLTVGPGRGKFGAMTAKQDQRVQRPGLPTSGPLPGGGLFGGQGSGNFAKMLRGLAGRRGGPGGPPGGGGPGGPPPGGPPPGGPPPGGGG